MCNGQDHDLVGGEAVRNRVGEASEHISMCALTDWPSAGAQAESGRLPSALQWRIARPAPRAPFRTRTRLAAGQRARRVRNGRASYPRPRRARSSGRGGARIDVGEDGGGVGRIVCLARSAREKVWQSAATLERRSRARVPIRPWRRCRQRRPHHQVFRKGSAHSL